MRLAKQKASKWNDKQKVKQLAKKEAKQRANNDDDDDVGMASAAAGATTTAIVVAPVVLNQMRRSSTSTTTVPSPPSSEMTSLLSATTAFCAAQWAAASSQQQRDDRAYAWIRAAQAAGRGCAWIRAAQAGGWGWNDHDEQFSLRRSSTSTTTVPSSFSSEMVSMSGMTRDEIVGVWIRAADFAGWVWNDHDAQFSRHPSTSEMTTVPLSFSSEMIAMITQQRRDRLAQLQITRFIPNDQDELNFDLRSSTAIPPVPSPSSAEAFVTMAASSTTTTTTTTHPLPPSFLPSALIRFASQFRQALNGIIARLKENAATAADGEEATRTVQADAPLEENAPTVAWIV